MHTLYIGFRLKLLYVMFCSLCIQTNRTKRNRNNYLFAVVYMCVCYVFLCDWIRTAHKVVVLDVVRLLFSCAHIPFFCLLCSTTTDRKWKKYSKLNMLKHVFYRQFFFSSLFCIHNIGYVFIWRPYAFVLRPWFTKWNKKIATRYHFIIGIGISGYVSLFAKIIYAWNSLGICCILKWS